MLGCNPYLELAALLKAGLQGIQEELVLPNAVEKSLYQMTQKERDALNIKALPSSLEQAIGNLQTSQIGRNILGESLFTSFINYTKKKVAAYNNFVTDWELREYF